MVKTVMIIGLAAVAVVSTGRARIQQGRMPKMRIPADVVPYHSEAHAVIVSQAESDASFNLGHRLLAVSLFILLAPVTTAPLASRVLDRRSNASNLLLLLGYTGLDILVVHVVGGLSIGGVISAIAYMVGLLAVFSYNLWICAFLARLRR